MAKEKLTVELTPLHLQIIRKALLQKWHREKKANDHAEANRIKSVLDALDAMEAKP